MIQRLRWKFVLINMLIVSVILTAVGVLMVVVTQDNLRQNSFAMLYQVAKEDFTFTWPHAHEDDGSDSSVRLPYFSVVVGVDGSVVLMDNQFGAVEDTDQLREIVQSCMEQTSNTGSLSEFRLRYLRQERMLGWRIFFVDTSQELSTLQALLYHLVIIFAGTLVLFFFISVLLARWATRPVEEGWKKQRQFVSDASHELKTPLTVILSNVDMLETYSKDLGDRERRWVDNIRASSGQMTELVEELLTLARSDNQSEKDLIREDVDFSELVTDEGLLFEGLLFEAGKTLEDHITENLTVTGDSSKLRRLVDILLDNAKKYAAPHSTVTLRLRPEGSKRVQLSVNTKGDPIPPEQLKRIFERFYRADQARSSEGFGLGLSIASRIAEEHQGKLWAQSSEGEGNTFFFSLPRKK